VATSIEDDDATQGVSAHEHAPTGPSRRAQLQTSLGRYVVLEQVGQGGMGVVHRAYDPKLRREVALKLLRLDRHGANAPRAELRILREAQTMARLSHPNVLPVYDVEPMGELVYIAMEYVDGETLGRWMRRTSHPWREVVECFRQAGQGLHAAHQAGIVHRDFKPSNVLLGNKGRVLVTDFGLARARDDDERLAPRHVGPPPGAGEPVTEDGEVVGTPAYMAPEQLRGEPVDARADQYAFCVALYEGLFGHRPFAYHDLRELLQAKQARRLAADPEAAVPGWLFRILERGMAPDPAQRFASMAELLHALGRDPAQARRRWAWAGSGALLGAALIGLGLASDPTPRCPEVDALVEEVWGEAPRERVYTALVTTAQSYAADMAERVTSGLADHARAWAEGHVEACEATRVRGEQSQAAYELRMTCLRRHRAELEATVLVLSERVSVATLRGAAGLVAALPRPEACADVEALLARQRVSDPAHAAELETHRDELSRARALVRAGRVPEARTLVDRVEARATALRDPIVRSEALWLRGTIAMQARDMPAAERWLTEAYAGAVEGRDATLALATAIELVDLVGVQLARPAEAALWAVQAHAWLRSSDEQDPQRARLSLAEGNVYRVAGRLEEARVALTDAVERMEARAPAGDLAEAHHTLGLALMSLGNAAEAERSFTRELTLAEAALGPNHPDVARTHQSLGATLYASGQLGRALPHLEDAVRIFEAALGPMHPRVAASLGNLGALRDDLGEPEEAREHFERALLILDSAEGTGSTELVGLLGNLAQALRHAGEPAAAAPHLRRAAALIEATHGPGHPERVALLTHLGEVLIEAGERAAAREVLVEAEALRHGLPPDAALVSANAARALAKLWYLEGEHERALPLLSDAIELYRTQGPVLDPHRGEALLELGEVLLAVGDPAAARGPLEAAQPLLVTPTLPAATLARARFALARALRPPG
jgi:eukaryotic-like serine/threonine-protein kinase